MTHSSVKMHAPQTNTMHKKNPGQVRVEMSGKSTSDGGIQPLRERSTLWMFPVVAVQIWMDAHTAPVCTNCHAWLQQLYLDLVGCWEQPWQPCRKSGREESLTLYSWDAHATQHTWLGQLRESSVWKKKRKNCAAQGQWASVHPAKTPSKKLGSGQKLIPKEIF